MRLGAEAALTILEEDADKRPPQVMCLDGNRIVKKSLMEMVEAVSVQSSLNFDVDLNPELMSDLQVISSNQ